MISFLLFYCFILASSSISFDHCQEKFKELFQLLRDACDHLLQVSINRYHCSPFAVLFWCKLFYSLKGRIDNRIIVNPESMLVKAWYDYIDFNRDCSQLSGEIC